MNQNNNDRSRIITIYQTNPFRLLPDDVKSEIVKRIGSSWDKGTKALKMGISEDEREYLLPSIIGTSYVSPQWENDMKNYFAELTIVIPNEGHDLNIATYKKNVMVKGNSVEVDYPVSPRDYIMWKQALVTEKVASNIEEVALGLKEFYIDDQIAVKSRKSQQSKDIDKITTEYTKLIATDDQEQYKFKKEITYICLVLGRNPKTMDVDDQVDLIRDIKNDSIKDIENHKPLAGTRLMQIVKDPNLKTRAWILNLLQKGFLIKQGEYIMDADNSDYILGKNMYEAIAWFNDKTNSDRINEYKLKNGSEKVLTV